MYDLHTHSIFSDGELIPAELIQRAKVAGYRAVAITDHVDQTNIDLILKNLFKGIEKMRPHLDIEVIIGVEITHVPPPLIKDLIIHAREIGAQIVVVHGETLVEPVPKGTNLAALRGRADILAHPGIISNTEAEIAAQNGVLLEITTRKGHCLSNGHVAKMAKKYNAALIMNNDAHAPEDLIPVEKRKLIAMGAGLSEQAYYIMEQNAEKLVRKILDK